MSEYITNISANKLKSITNVSSLGNKKTPNKASLRSPKPTLALIKGYLQLHISLRSVLYH